MASFDTTAPASNALFVVSEVHVGLGVFNLSHSIHCVLTLTLSGLSLKNQNVHKIGDQLFCVDHLSVSSNFLTKGLKLLR